MCNFARCYFANTKIDESFRTAKIRRTFFGNNFRFEIRPMCPKRRFGLRPAPGSCESKAGNSGTQVRTEQVCPEKFCGFVFFFVALFIGITKTKHLCK